jgi:hypothetical protein
VVAGGCGCAKAEGLGESSRPIGEELRGIQLRGGAKDKSGQVARVSGVTVCAGLVGHQGPAVAEGRTGTKGECRGSAE